MLFKDLLAHLLDIIGAIFRARPRAAPPVASPAPSMPPLPGPGRGEPHSRFGGRSWSFDSSGVRAEGFLWRTAGAPVTCRLILDTLGDEILAMARKHGVAPALIMMTIATEASGLRTTGFTGPRSFRWEGHVRNRDIVPEFRGSYSAGPMQILATTARDLIASGRNDYVLDYDRFAVAPAYRERPAAAPATHPLYLAAVNLDLGTAYIRRNLHLTGGDPILVAAAYNSGGLYQSTANPWHLRSHGDHLDRAARWYGDACAVLRERGLS